MDNQHRKIKGYRELTEEDIALMNLTKDLEEACNVLLEKLDGVAGIDKRWLSIGRTDLQKGFMSVVRSIARPATS